MSETYAGEVRNGVVVFEGSPPPLPDGTRVKVEVAGAVQIAEQPTTRTLAERLQAIIGAAKGLPADLAEQHDHYLHGQPKR